LLRFWSVRVGETLIREGAITGEQLEEALRAQVIYGGRLGTNLVELGHVDLDALAEILGAQAGLAAALQRHFDEANRSLQSRLAASLANERQCVPLAVVSEEPRLIAVAFMDPPDPSILGELSRALGAEIVPAIAPELRLRYQLERVYGIPRPNRYKRVRSSAQRVLDAGRTQEKRTYVRPLTGEEPALDADAEDTPALGRISLKKSYRRADTAALETLPDFDSAIRLIRRSHDRDKIVDTVLRCMREGLHHRLGIGVFLVVRNDTAIGWRGYSHFADADDAVGSIAVSLEEPSLFQLAYGTQVPVCGRPPELGVPVNQRFWSALGSAPPAEVVCCPIVVDSFVVGLLYAHAEDLGPIPAELSDQVIELARCAGSAFLRLIRSSER